MKVRNQLNSQDLLKGQGCICISSLILLKHQWNEIFESLVHLTVQDVVLIFGFVKLHPETKVILNYSQEVGATSIVMTDCLISDFDTTADIILFASRGELWEFHSMIAPTF
ncbi:hypothetical protein ACFVP8_03070 [Viridibacillus arvi]|uniref:hypothetical protein n=1 Tax=Viridibacillus arvi TaxID=263475 RepID=UPI0036C137BE